MNEQILVVAPHPDDEVLGCGGTIARHIAHGDSVNVLIVSRGIPEIFAPEEIEKTREELRKAHSVLNVTQTYFLDFPAPQLDIVPKHELIDSINKIISETRPGIVYSPYWGDIHADHREVFHAVLVASRPINDCPVRKLLSYETLSETEWSPPSASDAFVPTVFVNIEDYLERKLEAMSCYRSQLKEPPHPRSLESIERLARLRGNTVSLQAAEAFVLIRSVID